jgi:protein-L-isoaspartate O-methyltransferase
MFVAEVFATMDELVDTLKRSNIIKSREVEEVMRRVDRKHFLDVNPYEDAP